MHENTRRHPIGSIDGDSDALRGLAARFRRLAEDFEHLGVNIKKIDAPRWEGVAADAFRSIRDSQAKRCFDASDNLTQKAAIYDDQAKAVDWAWRERDQARWEWDEGYRLTESAATATPDRQKAWKKQRTVEFVFGKPPRPVFPNDEGAAMREHAIWRYYNAKTQLAALSDAAVQDLRKLATTAPVRTLPSREGGTGGQ